MMSLWPSRLSPSFPTTSTLPSLSSSLLAFQHMIAGDHLSPPVPSETSSPLPPPSSSPKFHATPTPLIIASLPAASLPTSSLPLPPPVTPSASPSTASTATSSLLSALPPNSIDVQQLAIQLLPSPSLHPASSSSSSSSASPTTPSYLTTPHPLPRRSSSALATAATAVSTTTSVIVSDERIEVDPYDALTAALVPNQLSLSYSTHPSRVYILLLACTVSAMQGATYVTFSTIPDYFNLYFRQPPRDQHLLDLLLNWGPIVYLPTVFLAAWLQSWPQGLRRSLLLAGLLCFLGNGMRMIPTFFTTQYRDDNLTWMLIFLHAGTSAEAHAHTTLAWADEQMDSLDVAVCWLCLPLQVRS